MRLHLPLRAQLDHLGLHVWLLEWDKVACMDDGWSSLAVNWFNSDSLVIRPCHTLNSEWSVCLGIHLCEAPVALKDKLAGLEVEQEHGRLPLVLMAMGQRAHALLRLTHP